MTVRLAVSIGDPNGIGPEIALKAVALLAADDVALTLVGDRHVIERTARRLPQPVDLTTLRIEDVGALGAEAWEPGRVTAAAGRATIDYVLAAIARQRRGEADAVLACPHSETAIHSAGIAFSGYPSILARATGMNEDQVFLMLAAAGLKIAHVTLHQSVASALRDLSVERVVAAATAAVDAMRGLGVAAPTLGVFGINPHAGEGGLFGDEDRRITEPAVRRLREAGLAVDGPAGGDVLLAARRHDAYLAMFHDQGHIPIKLVSPLRASAMSIGTPVPFSSVGHGSAHDIAGRGVADPTGVVETARLLMSVRGRTLGRPA